MRADRLTDPVAHHGEGLVWSPRWGGLRWVGRRDGDILALTVGGSPGAMSVASPPPSCCRSAGRAEYERAYHRADAARAGSPGSALPPFAVEIDQGCMSCRHHLWTEEKEMDSTDIHPVFRSPARQPRPAARTRKR